MDEHTDLEKLKVGTMALGQQLQKIQEVLKSNGERAIIFIDNTNLHFTIRKVDACGNYRICYNKLIQFLAGNRLLKQARIYYSDFEDSARRQDREKFYNWLRWQGYWLKACSLVERSDGTTKEKGLDAAIVKDMERLCQRNACDTIILVAGDADYREMVEEAQANYGMKVEVAFFQDFAAPALQCAATKFINLTEVKETLRRDTQSS